MAQHHRSADRSTDPETDFYLPATAPPSLSVERIRRHLASLRARLDGSSP